MNTFHQRHNERKVITLINSHDATSEFDANFKKDEAKIRREQREDVTAHSLIGSSPLVAYPAANCRYDYCD